MTTPFQGLLEIASPSGEIAASGLRARFNEKGDFLIAATPPIDEADPGRNRIFSHLVDGGGYSTQIVLVSTTASQNATGSVQFVSQVGNPWSLLLR